MLSAFLIMTMSAYTSLVGDFHFRFIEVLCFFFTATNYSSPHLIHEELNDGIPVDGWQRRRKERGIRERSLPHGCFSDASTNNTPSARLHV